MKLRFIAATIVAMLGGTVAFAAPANASVSQGYVAGSGTITDDWGDEGPLSTTSHSFSNAVALWQVVLLHEGLYTGAIDCRFGSGTKSATEAFQRRYRLSLVDGIAGPQTLGTADNNLSISGSTVFYKGNATTLKRINDVYYVRLNFADRVASYTSTAGC